MTAAETCRANGWGVGTVLVQYGAVERRTATITAVGRRSVLVVIGTDPEEWIWSGLDGWDLLDLAPAPAPDLAARVAAAEEAIEALKRCEQEIRSRLYIDEGETVPTVVKRHAEQIDGLSRRVDKMVVMYSEVGASCDVLLEHVGALGGRLDAARAAVNEARATAVDAKRKMEEGADYCRVLVRNALSALGEPEVEPYPDDDVGAWEKSLRSGGRMVPMFDRVMRAVNKINDRLTMVEGLTLPVDGDEPHAATANPSAIAEAEALDERIDAERRTADEALALATDARRDAVEARSAATQMLREALRLAHENAALIAGTAEHPGLCSRVEALEEDQPITGAGAHDISAAEERGAARERELIAQQLDLGGAHQTARIVRARGQQ